MRSIRPYRPEDRDDVYEVCVRTGATGGDARGLYSDDDLLPDVYAGPYLLLEPELAFVVDTGGRVSGYVLGTADTVGFVRRYRDEWLPRFAARHPRQAATAEEQHVVDAGYNPSRMLIPEIDVYPAHLHIDLLPELQGQGFGRRLVRTMLAALRERGVQGLNLGVSGENLSARAFYARIGFIPLPSGTPGGPVLGIRTDAPV